MNPFRQPAPPPSQASPNRPVQPVLRPPQPQQLQPNANPLQQSGNPFVRSPVTATGPAATAPIQIHAGNNQNSAGPNRPAFNFQLPAPKQPVQDSPDAPLPPFEIGMTIDSDRIKLLDFVGQGSFAHVYLGYDYSTSSKCAVKCLMKAGADPKKMAMQKREVNAMEDLNGHPNVIRLIRTVDTSEWLLIIMEFCQIDLYEAIMQKGGFPDFAVKDVFSQLCDGVMHCHSRGYYHRDLKPENILLDVAALTAKITDFGLATRDTWCYEMGCGSTRYIPPEACATADPTKGYSPIASDVWALGILLVNLLFSKNPWFEATMTDPIFSIYVTSRPDILRHHFKISAEFDSILRRVFSLDPSKRLSLPEFKRLINSLPSFMEEDSESSVPSAQYPQQPVYQAPPDQNQQVPQPFPGNTLPQQRAPNPFGSGKNPFGSGKTSFGSSKMQGPLVVFGSIPDPKNAQDPRNPFNSNPRASPMNFTSTDFNPFASANAAFTSHPHGTPESSELDEHPVNPFFSIPSDGSIAISPSAHLLDPAFASPHWPQNVQPPSPALPPVIAPINPSLTTLIWTAPARVAAPELPNTLTLGREGIGRIGISRLATAKQKLTSRRGLHLPNGASSGVSGELLHHHHHHHHHFQTNATTRPAFGLAFLGTAIAGYVNPDSESDEIFEGDHHDDFNLDNEGDSDDLDDVRGADINRSAPDEESHYEIVKVDRRLIPDLEKGIKRAVNRGMKKFRPFMQLGATAGTSLDGEGGLGGGSGGVGGGVGSGSNLKLGKDVAGHLGNLSTEDWSEFSTNPKEVNMPGAFVFATESERRKSAPLLPHGGKLSSDHLDVTNELPLYNDSGRSPLRGGQSTDELSWGDESGVVDSSEDDIRTSRSRRRNNGETVLSKMYNGLAGMSILGGGNGSRSKSLKRMSETKSSGALPLHAQESSSILPAPQVPFAFMVAKTAKSRASEKDFEDLVVNAKPSVGTIPQVVPRHRHRVKNKQSIDDPVNNPRRASMSNPASYSTSLQDLDDPSASLGRPSSIMGQFSPDSITSSNRLSLGRIPAQLEGTSPNRISLSRPVPIEPHFLVPAAAGMMHTTVDAPAEQLSNPFRPLNANNANPFQPQQRPSSMYQYQTSNPFQPQGLAHDQQHQQHHQQQQPHHQQQQQVNPNYRYSMPLSNVDVIVGGYNLQQPNQPHQQPPESPFKPLPHQPQYQQHQQPQQQPQQQQVQHHHQQQHQPQHQHLYQQNGLHNQASLPNLALYHNTARSTTPFTDAGNLERAQLPRSIPLHDDDGSGGDSGIAGRGRGGGGGGGGEGETSQDEDDSEEDDNETDQDPISNGGRRRRRKKKGEDRYVRGLVRGFGWLVGSSGRDANNVERSDSHGV